MKNTYKPNTMKKTIEEVAVELYREYPNNPLDKPEWKYNKDINCFRKRKAFIAGAKYQREQMYSEEEVIQFTEWISHNDWVYLPSKNYWVDEEHEELEQKLSSKEIIKLWKESQS